MPESPTSQYTGTFLELLAKANRSLVVSTYQARKLVLLRVQGQDINTHFVDLNKPMGVAFQNGRLSVGSGNRVVDYFNSPSAARKVAPADTYDGAFLPRRAHITGDIDIHEMAFDGANELWIVNTRMSCLCTLDASHSFRPQWRPPFISGYDVTDRCHLNGLAMRDGKPRYITALGNTDKPAGWRDKKADGGILMDIDSSTIIADGLSMPHSPRWYRNKLWVLESGAGQLISVDENSGEKTVIAQLPGFCRGIDFIERYAVIGLSEVRETAVFAGLPLTEREQDRKCGIWIVDIETGLTAGHLVFTKGVQEIFGVQCLPMRYPAFLDFNDKLLDTTYSVPDNVINDFVAADPKQINTEKAREYHHRKEFKAAIDLYRSILEEDPDNLNILYYLADALASSDQWDEAIGYLHKILAAQNNHADAHHLCGHFYAYKKDFDKAVACYEKAIAVDQQFASAHFHRGCIQLRRGDFLRGWQGFEWRTQMPGFKSFSLPHPKWQGEEISDQTLLILTEPGFGDAIRFARFLPMAKQRCSKLMVVCDEPLRLLIKEMPAVDEVRLHGELQKDLFDVYCSIMSLAAVLQISTGNLPTQTPYLTINKQVVVADLNQSANRKDRTAKIGLVWSGSPRQSADQSRACPLDQIIGLTDNRNVQFYSFQTPVFAEDRNLLAGHNIVDLENELTNFAQTGALMQQMDLIVSVCTATADLAGALGLPSIVLLSDQADWRWMEDKKTSTWYPSTELLRQKNAGDWSSVLEQCAMLIKKRFG